MYISCTANKRFTIKLDKAIENIKKTEMLPLPEAEKTWTVLFPV